MDGMRTNAAAERIRTNAAAEGAETERWLGDATLLVSPDLPERFAFATECIARLEGLYLLPEIWGIVRSYLFLAIKVGCRFSGRDVCTSWLCGF
jgi:hypothetical protein